MIGNNVIDHKDIIKLGYIFLDKDDERTFLKAINDELYMRLEQSAISAGRSDNKDCSVIKADLLEELRQKRKKILIRDCIEQY